MVNEKNYVLTIKSNYSVEQKKKKNKEFLNLEPKIFTN